MHLFAYSVCLVGPQRIEIEMFPANHGDCFLIRCSGAGKPKNILVDGGLKATYETWLRPRLVELAAGGEVVDLLVATHIDVDHIEGILAFLTENGDAASPSIIAVSEVWHNSYRHLGLEGRAATEAEVAKVEAQVVNPSLNQQETKDIGAKHGSALAALLRLHGYRWNESVGGARITHDTKRVSLGDVHLQVLSPGPAQLTALGRVWQRELLKFGVSHDAVLGEAFEDAFEAEMLRALDLEPAEEKDISQSELQAPPDEHFEEDRSPANGSSIAFALEFGTARIAMLGDAFPSVVLEALGPDDSHSFDLVKVSHHGSRKSTSPALQQALDCRLYAVSTDGSRHHHPHLESLLRIIASQDRGCRLVFNYPTETANELSKGAAIQKLGHSVAVSDGATPVRLVIREDGDVDEQ